MLRLFMCMILGRNLSFRNNSTEEKREMKEDTQSSISYKINNLSAPK